MTLTPFARDGAAGGFGGGAFVASGKEDIDQEGGRGKRKIMRGD